MDISEQAAAILEKRHQSERELESKPERQSSKPSKRDREARTLNVAIDNKVTELAESSAKSPGRIERMDDDEFADMVMGG